MFGSSFRWPLRRSRPIAERVWNALTIAVRHEVLVREGFSADRAFRLCSKPWKKLSEAERIWLATPISLDEMTRVAAVEVHPSKAALTAFRFRLFNLFSIRTRP
jgi:hypothetical protein